MNVAPVLQPRRFVGIDLHKDYVMIGAVDAQQNIVLTPRRCRLFVVERLALDLFREASMRPRTWALNLLHADRAGPTIPR
jgi:hypothetical protein